MGINENQHELNCVIYNNDLKKDVPIRYIYSSSFIYHATTLTSIVVP